MFEHEWAYILWLYKVLKYKLEKDSYAMPEEDAKKWTKDKSNQDMVVKKFLEDHPPHPHKLAFFMAGIPGAGKTEFAENTINRLKPEAL